ncbi:uncharacterized protein [Malus domestica]|uniref:uncharacterized protein isoform X3 n=1 Tax=Malus domestica TaxID=3750 RepID=UPI0004986FE1|nr:uncharacterized protein LOC103444905 isoform X2 [Malus domestica]
MAAASQSVASCCSGLVHRSSHAKLPFGIKQCNGAKINNCNDVLVTSRWIVRGGRGIQYLTAHRVGTICAASVGRDHRQLRIDDDSPQEPYFLSLVKEAVRGLRSLFVFLVEQPSQLKYIEWPGFRSTVCTKQNNT